MLTLRLLYFDFMSTVCLYGDATSCLNFETAVLEEGRETL